LSPFRVVTPDFAVSPQLGVADLLTARAQDFELVINNRPDGEAPDQPTGAAIEAAASAQGLDYIHIPVIGRPTAEQARAVAEAAHGRRTVAFCRSGNRSIMAWALGELAAGRDRDELLRLAAAAGYDLGAVLPP
jgi:uncharacterized protein (TIGR01244 family)